MTTVLLSVLLLLIGIAIGQVALGVAVAIVTGAVATGLICFGRHIATLEPTRRRWQAQVALFVACLLAAIPAFARLQPDRQRERDDSAMASLEDRRADVDITSTLLPASPTSSSTPTASEPVSGGRSSAAGRLRTAEPSPTGAAPPLAVATTAGAPSTSTPPLATAAEVTTTTTSPTQPVKAYNFNAQEVGGQPHATYMLAPRQYLFQPLMSQVDDQTYRYFTGIHFVATCSTAYTCTVLVQVFRDAAGADAVCASPPFLVRQGWTAYDVARGVCPLDPARPYFVQLYSTSDSTGTISLALVDNTGKDGNLNAFAPAQQGPVPANTVVDGDLWLQK